MKIRIATQVLNGATGEVREIVANVEADTEQQAVDKLFFHVRKDDYYYRFLGMHGVINPSASNAVSMSHQNQIYWEAQ